MMTLSSSVLPRPPPPTVPIVATSTDLGMYDARRWPAKGAVVAPAAGAATRTIPPATAMPSITMTCATTPSFGAPVRALCNVDGVPVGGGGASGIGGTNCDMPPDWLVRRMKFGMIALAVVSLVMVASIVALVVLVRNPPKMRIAQHIHP